MLAFSRRDNGLVTRERINQASSSITTADRPSWRMR